MEGPRGTGISHRPSRFESCTRLEHEMETNQSLAKLLIDRARELRGGKRLEDVIYELHEDLCDIMEELEDDENDD